MFVITSSVITARLDDADYDIRDVFAVITISTASSSNNTVLISIV